MSTLRTFDGVDLHVSAYGPEDVPVTVVLAHCWTLDEGDWRYQVRDLQREFGHAIRILTWDHRGHGRSGGSARKDCLIEHLAHDMGAVIDSYAGTGKLVLAGHSIGGMTMMALAEVRPDILERVVGAAFVATSSGAMDTVTLGLPEMGPFVRAQIPRILALRSRTLSRRARRRAPIIERRIVRNLVFGRPMRLVDAAQTVEGLINSSADTVVGFYEECMRHERTDALKAYDGIPTHVLVGTRDVLTPPHHARRIADAVQGAVLTVLPDAGHMLPFERDETVSGLLVRLVRPHLDRVDA